MIMKRKPNLIEMFERINGTKIPSTALINEMMENNIRMKTPWSAVVDFFNHYKIDVSKMDQNLVRQIFVNWDNAPFDGISDLEESPDGKVSVEFDGTYGKHWMTFDSHEEWDKYYNDRVLGDAQNAFNTMVKHYEEKIADRQQKKDQEVASRNTIGNMVSPDVLNKLKTSTVSEHQGDIFAPTTIGQEPYAKPNQEEFNGTDPILAPVIPEGNRPGIVDKEVRYLKVGDVLSGSGAKIITAPVAGLYTPKGKVEIGVEYAGGRRKRQIWGKYTIVGVRDSTPVQPLPPDPNKLPDQISNNEQPSINLEEMAQYKPQTYFNTQAEALEDAFKVAESKGFTVVQPESIWTEHVGYGQTVKYDLELTKDGLPVKNRLLHIILYRMDSGKYELTAYIG